jgi:tail protein (putative endopeptidase)
VALLYASSHGYSQVDLVDTAAGTLIKSIALASSMSPGVLRLSPDGTLLAVLGSAAVGNSVLCFIPTGTNVAGPMININTPQTAAGASDMQWSADSQTLFILTPLSMLPVDRSGTLLTTIPTPGTITPGPMVSNSTHSVFYCGIGGGTSSQVVPFTPSGTSGSFGTGWGVPFVAGWGGGVYGMEIAIGDGLLYVSAYNSNWPNGKLYTLTTGGTWSAGLDVPAGTWYFGNMAKVPTTGDLYVALYRTVGTNILADAVCYFDATAAAILGTLTGFEDVVSFAALQNGTRVWAGNYYNDSPHRTLVDINTSTHAVGTGINLAAGTSGVAEGLCLSLIIVGPITVAASGTVSGSGIHTGTAALTIGPLTITATGTVSGSGGGAVTGSVQVVLSVVINANSILGGRGFASVQLKVQVFALGGRLGPKAWPVPGYRGAWRLTLHKRTFAAAPLMSTIIAELTDARGRKLEQAWNTPAQMTFTLDGQSDSAALIDELLQDVALWRWDDQTGSEFVIFRGPITQSEDQLNEQSHVVTYTCHDYAAVMSRRLMTLTHADYPFQDQDEIVGALVSFAKDVTSTSGVWFGSAAYIPLGVTAVGPAGNLRGTSGQIRSRTYYGSQNIYDAFDALGKVINGFDWDVQPSAIASEDSLRIFYPQQGVTRSDFVLQYGGNVSSVTRTVDSSEYGNYVRVLGNSGSTDPTVQLWKESWIAGITTAPVGLWMSDENASDVTIPATLQEKADGDLAFDSILQPHYTLKLTPNTYEYGSPNMGDVVQLIIQSGRLNVNTQVRVLGITYDIGEDGNEDVSLIVSRPQSTLAKIFRKALDRR